MRPYPAENMSSMTYEARILSDLLKRNHRLSAAGYVGEFPGNERQAVRTAIDSIVQRGFARRRRIGGQEHIELVKDMAGDAKKLANTIGTGDATSASIDKLIPRGYTAPFHTTMGEHRVRGHVSTYAFCYSSENAGDVSCFVVGSQDRVQRIHLGVLADPRSLAARFLGKIDEVFGSRRFAKEEVKGFGPELVGNNQPTKAAIDYLCHEGFLIKSEYDKGPARFERTGKPRPAPAAGADAPDKDASRREQTDEYPFYQ